MATKQALPKEQALIKELKERLSRRRWLIERNWWGNTLYYLGLQWIVYDTTSRRWRQRKLSPSTPTPITNLFRSTLDTVKSAIAQHSPRFLGTPTRDDSQAVAAAGSVDIQLAIILREGEFNKARRRMLDWLLLTGNAFMEVVYDTGEETGLTAIPYEKCMECGKEMEPGSEELDKVTVGEMPACPDCQSPWLADSDSNFKFVPRGRIRFDTASPFEVYIDPAIEELQDQPFMLVVKSYTTEQIKEIWDKDVEPSQAYGGLGDLMRDTVPTLATTGAGAPFGAQSAYERENRVQVIRAFIKRHKEYPDGTYLVMTAGGQILEQTKKFPWVHKVSGRKYYPWVHFKFGTVGGRAWGFTPADDLLPKQYQLNKAESLFTLIITRMANPVWLIPANSNPTRITGDIGIQIEYTQIGQAAPSRISGAEAPQSLVVYIKDIRQSFDELSGAFAAVRGRLMGSRTPVGTVQALQERGFGRWATVFANLEEGYSDLAKAALEVWRSNINTPRVQAVRDAVGGWTFNAFMGADWVDGVDVEVEAGSSRPVSHQEKLQTYAVLGQMGVINFADKAQSVKLLEDTGMSNILPGVEEDTKQAYKENAEYMSWAQRITDEILTAQIGVDPEVQTRLAGLLAEMPITVLPLVDNHEVHFLTHRRLCMTDMFKGLPSMVQQVMFQHMLGHKENILVSKIFEQAAAPMQSGGGQASTPVHSANAGVP